MTVQPLAGLRVVDLGGLPTAYGTMLLAGLGADVIRVEPPEGDPLRTLPPFLDGVEAPESSLWFAYFGQGKKSVVLDVTAETGQRDLQRLLDGADVVFAAGDSGDLRRHDRLVWVAVTPFGLTGPRRDWRGSDLVAWASAGVLYTVGFTERPPVLPAGPVQLASHVAGLNAACGALLAVRSRNATGRGQVVDISMQETTLALAPETGAPLFLDDRVHRPRTGNRRDLSRPFGLYPCADGFVSFLVLQPAHWNAMATWISEVTGTDVLMDDTFADVVVRREASEFIDDFTEQVTRPRTKLELFHEGQRRGIPVTPVNTIADLATDPHLEAVGFFEEGEHPLLGGYRRPGPPFRVGHPWWNMGRAPLLGEHTEDVLGGG